jgi:hypothetical protein
MSHVASVDVTVTALWLVSLKLARLRLRYNGGSTSSDFSEACAWEWEGCVDGSMLFGIWPKVVIAPACDKSAWLGHSSGMLVLSLARED